MLPRADLRNGEIQWTVVTNVKPKKKNASDIHGGGDDDKDTGKTADNVIRVHKGPFCENVLHILGMMHQTLRF